MMGFSSKISPGLMISQARKSHLSPNHEENLNLRRNNFVFILLVVLLNLNIIGDVIVFGNMQNMENVDKNQRSLLQRKRGDYVYNEDEEGQKMEKFGYNKSLEGNVVFGNSSLGIDVEVGFVDDFNGGHPGNLLQKMEDHVAYLRKDRRMKTRDSNLNEAPRGMMKIDDGSELIQKHKFGVSQESETRKHHTKRRHHSTKDQLGKEPGTGNQEILQQGYYGSILTGIADDNVQGSASSTHAERRQHLGGDEIRLQQEDDNENDNDDDMNFPDEDKSWKEYFWKNIVHRSRKARSRKLSRKLRVPGDDTLERGDGKHQNSTTDQRNNYEMVDLSTDLELGRLKSSYKTNDGTEFGRRREAQKGGETAERVLERLGETKVKTYPTHSSNQGDRRKNEHKSKHSRLPEDLVANAEHLSQEHSKHHHRDPNQHINILPEKPNHDIRLDSILSEEPKSDHVIIKDDIHEDHNEKTVEHILEHHKTNVKHKKLSRKEHTTRRLRFPEDITPRNHHHQSQASSNKHSKSCNSKQVLKTHSNQFNIDSNALSKIEENNVEEIPLSQSSSNLALSSEFNAYHSENLSDFQLHSQSLTNSNTRRRMSHFHDSSSNRLNPFYKFNSFKNIVNASSSSFNGFNSSSNSINTSLNTSDEFHNSSNAFITNQSSEFKPKPRFATNSPSQRNSFKAFSSNKLNPFSNFNGFGNNFNSSSNSFNNYHNNFNSTSNSINSFYNNFNSSSNSFYNNFNTSFINQSSDYLSKQRSSTNFLPFTNNIASKNNMFFNSFNDFYNSVNTSYNNQSSDYLPKPRSATNNFLPKKSGRFYEEATTYFQGTDKPVWPVKKEAVLEGDIILGGLMMVHEREESITCGPIMPEGGVQALEAMLYTLDVLNSRPDKKFTLGAHILDDCDKDTYGLEMAVDFIKGSISNIEDAEFHCNKTQVRKVISGVVGAASSVTSIQVANLLRLFKIPQVSFFSTSPELSNKQRFEYFTRTIPSDHHQVQAMVEIVRRLRWSYVSIIYEESNYGIKAFEELEVLLAKYDICIAVKEKLVKDSGVAEETSYDSIVQKLLTKPRAKGTIIFGSDQEVAGFMRAVRRCNATGAFSWIGSDGWSARSLVWQGQEAEVEGTLSVQPQANPVKGFDNYFLNLTVENNKRNPWFVEFWEDHFQCRYPNSSRTPYNQKYSRECDSNLRLNRDSTRFENQLQFVSDAVMAFAVAFHDMHREVCGVTKKRGLCDAMRPIKGPDLLKYLRKVNFEGLSGDKFRFDPNGDGPARYNIIHFKQISAGNFSWIRVGEYIEGELRLDMDAIQFRLGHTKHPDSVCSFPCELGQAKKYVEGESCCWHCFNCSQYQVRHHEDETQCLSCPWGTIPDPSKQHCLHIPEVFLRAESAWAICAMCLSATGILLTLFIIGVFVRHNDTPVVKAAGRELSYVLLTGILLCYLVTFVLVLRPTDVVCGIQRFGTGFCFTVVYAAILTKTNRISRIFNAGKRTAKRPSFITPKSQLIICSGFVSVQVVINGIWMLVSPPKAMHHYPTREENLLVCSSYVDASYMIAFGYPIVLIIICTVYAVLTRNIPEAFNESKHIGFTMYTTCVIWLAFVPLFFGTGSHMPLRITSMSVTISLSASVTIACLFSPKLYIILIRPERNVRQSMMPTSKYSGTVKSGTSASVMAAAVAVTNTQRLSQPFINAVDPSVASRCIDIELCSDETGFNRFSSLKIKDPILVTRSTQTVVIATANEQPSHLMATTNGRPANNNNNNHGPNGRAPYLNFGSAGNLNGDSKIGVSGGINVVNVPSDVTNVLSGSTINVPSSTNVLTSATNVLGGAANVLGVATNVLTGATNVLGSAPNILGGATNVLTVTTNGSNVTNNIVGSTTNIVASVTNVNSGSNVVGNGPML